MATDGLFSGGPLAQVTVELKHTVASAHKKFGLMAVRAASLMQFDEVPDPVRPLSGGCA